jgi:hypothetical protein
VWESSRLTDIERAETAGCGGSSLDWVLKVTVMLDYTVETNLAFETEINGRLRQLNYN